MFLEADDNDIKNPWVIKQPMPDERIKKFQSVSTKTYKIMNMLKGINEHYPIVFDTLHYSSVHISIYSMLTGKIFFPIKFHLAFKFRKKLLSEIREPSALRSSESGIKVVKLKPTKSKLKKRNLVKMESLTELLFSEDKEDENSVGYLPIEVDIKEVEKVHHLYIQSLINTYEKLKK